MGEVRGRVEKRVGVEERMLGRRVMKVLRRARVRASVRRL